MHICPLYCSPTYQNNSVTQRGGLLFISTSFFIALLWLAMPRNLDISRLCMIRYCTQHNNYNDKIAVRFALTNVTPYRLLRASYRMSSTSGFSSTKTVSISLRYHVTYATKISLNANTLIIGATQQFQIIMYPRLQLATSTTFPTICWHFNAFMIHLHPFHWSLLPRFQLTI